MMTWLAVIPTVEPLNKDSHFCPLYGGCPLLIKGAFILHFGTFTVACMQAGVQPCTFQTGLDPGSGGGGDLPNPENQFENGANCIRV